ncbi:MAG: hypothetical protein GTO71_00740 [Woeseiaceae bacterium]|nr:hypothetical protein [Woeseiaceae bacterium]NIP19645.1 hypothetical protein [Woeseiaceae bacterium]NIS89762.1 hypothetical protein [Woeseiaceae bacterium]
MSTFKPGILLSLLILPLVASGQDSDSGGRHPLFQTDEVLKAVLTAPIAQTYAQRHQEVRIYHPGQWTYTDEDDRTQRLDVSIRTRGHFRREVCDLPPLQLNFKKSQVKGTLFAGQNKVKLVAPCKEGKRYQQYVILEYLAYRTYQILTDHSFSARLVRLSYVDRDEQLEPWTDFAFMIEDDSDMAKRLDLDRLNIESTLYSQLDHPRTALLQVFQLMIANNDYSVIKPSGDDDCCHNIQLIGIEEDDGSVLNGNIIPVPYDFDFSGLVNATYAAPPSQLPIRDVRFRYFYGLCQPRPIIDAAIAHIQSKRDEILALYANTLELDDGLRKKTIKYIEEFFEIIDNPESVEKEIVGRCRGINLMNKHFGESIS